MSILRRNPGGSPPTDRDRPLLAPRPHDAHVQSGFLAGPTWCPPGRRRAATTPKRAAAACVPTKGAKAPGGSRPGSALAGSGAEEAVNRSATLRAGASGAAGGGGDGMRRTVGSLRSGWLVGRSKLHASSLPLHSDSELSDGDTRLSMSLRSRSSWGDFHRRLPSAHIFSLAWIRLRSPESAYSNESLWLTSDGAGYRELALVDANDDDGVLRGGAGAGCWKDAGRTPRAARLWTTRTRSDSNTVCGLMSDDTESDEAFESTRRLSSSSASSDPVQYTSMCTVRGLRGCCQNRNASLGELARFGRASPWSCQHVDCMISTGNLAGKKIAFAIYWPGDGLDRALKK